jgi:hypothetical protein
MSCFGCCGENDIHKTADTGTFMANHSAGDSLFSSHTFSFAFLVGPSYSFTLKLVKVFFFQKIWVENVYAWLPIILVCSSYSSTSALKSARETCLLLVSFFPHAGYV